MGYQPKKTNQYSKLGRLMRLKNCGNMDSAEFYKTRKVSDICNEVMNRLNKPDCSLADVIIYQDRKIDELQKEVEIRTNEVDKISRKLNRNVTAKKLVEFEERIDELEQENRDLRNELVLVKAKL